MRLKPPKDSWGNVIEPLRVPIVTAEGDSPPGPHIVVDAEIFGQLKHQGELSLRDARNKKRKITIERSSHTEVWGLVGATTYLTSNLPFNYLGLKYQFGIFQPLDASLQLQQEDVLMVYGSQVLGQNAQYLEDGTLHLPACISCTNEQVFADVKPGERIFFDDGKISGAIEEVTDEVMKVRITSLSDKPQNLKADKGINLPDSLLTLSGLTEKDREDLKFVAHHADVVNFSFVNCAQDVFRFIGGTKTTWSTRASGYHSKD